MNPAFSASKRRHSLETDFTLCIICQSCSNDEINNLTRRGLPTFLKALEARQDDVYDRLWGFVQNTNNFIAKDPKCHRSCRSSYTHKKELEALMAKRQNTSRDLANSTTGKSTCKPGRSSVVNLNSCCFICNKPRDSKGIWHLILVATEQRQNSIYKNALRLQDEAILRKIQGLGNKSIDMIAAGFRYHKSCMNVFMNKKDKEETLSNKTGKVYGIAFSQLTEEISESLFKERSAFHLTQLRNRLRAILHENGIENASSYRTDQLRKRLLDHYGSAIQIIPQRGKSSLVCSSDITVSEMCSIAAKLQQQVDKADCMTESDCSGNEEFGGDKFAIQSESHAVAKHMRTKMKNVAKKHRERLKEAGQLANAEDHEAEVMEISYGTATKIIPNDLYNHVAWMVTDTDAGINDNGKVILSEYEHHKVLNISQEIMSHVTTMPMPKQVGLAIHILNQTGSKELVRILNKYGHAISYDEAQRYISTRAQEIDQQTQHHGIFIPAGLQKGVFTQCALDNLDLHENTNDGSTLHATSHNIYQYSPNDDVTPATGSVPFFKIRRKTVQGCSSFTVSESHVRIKDRRESRSLHNVPLTTPQPQPKSFIEDELFIWSLARLLIARKGEDTNLTISVPTWNRFYEIISEGIHNPTIIGYGPLFPKSPTDPDVVKTSLDYLVSLSLKLGQQTTVITVDQAIYDIVKGITWKHADKYSDLVVRLGGFHIAENFMGCIGHLMKNSGIEDIMVYSEMLKRGTANKVISGKDYYKMVRSHSLIAEAMVDLLWKAFEDWQNLETEEELLSSINNHLHLLSDTLHIKDSAASRQHLVEVKADLSALLPVWGQFIGTLGATAKYWLLYIDMVMILKRYIRSERDGLWLSHLDEVQNMLPYIVAAHHTRYMICIPLYLRDMRDLPEKHPYVHKNFVQGNFTVHRTHGKFNGVWTDMALEQTYNNEGKTSLFKGISQSDATREKYIKTIPFMISISESVKSMAKVTLQQAGHHGETQNQAQYDHYMVEKIKKVITDQIINPFACSNQTDLLNISTGEKAATTDLIYAREKGLESLQKAEQCGYAKIDPPQLSTFASQTKLKPTKNKVLLNIYQDESAVIRALCFLQSADSNTRETAFSHEWTNYPSSLFEVDPNYEQGFAMQKGTKSDFLTSLMFEAEHNELLSYLPYSDMPTVYLIDAMAFVNKYQKQGAKTFGELHDWYMNKIFQLKPSGCSCINIIGDRYDFEDNFSLKTYERQRRTDGDKSKEYHPSASLGIPDWKLFIRHPKNKANLLEFIASSLSNDISSLPNEMMVILGGMSKDKGEALKITSASTSVLDLRCEDHEEADTRLIAHLAYCVEHLGHTRAVVHANDTDIIILCMYHFCRLQQLNELWVQKNSEYLPVHKIVQLLCEKFHKEPSDLTETLLCMYVFSGCDSVSYPFRIGKRKAAKVALRFKEDLPLLTSFGATIPLRITPELIDESKKYFIALYGQKGASCLNKLRQHMFASTKSDLRSLPCTDDAFYFHALRALYQIAVYKRAHLAQLSLPVPINFGWRLQNRKLIPILMSKPAKPNINKPVSCKCKKSKCLLGCSCMKASVSCCATCTCLGKREMCGRIPSDSSDEEDI